MSFTVEPGSVTGFLGPNGAGKTTTLRMVLGLATPTAGVATIGGLPYAQIPNPGRMVGAVLEATSFHPGRTARNHLRTYCVAAGLPDSRADEVLDQVGLADAARKTVRGFSLGMRQRLALATALLGDPRVLILDEPANGLDPEGIAWLRGFLRHLADSDKRTVLVSSHVLSEVEQTVDRVVILARGRLVRQGRLAELAADQSSAVLVRTPSPDRLVEVLAPLGATVEPGPDGGYRVLGVDPEVVGHEAWKAHVELHELTAVRSDLEQIFLDLTGNGNGNDTAGQVPATATVGGQP
ncbi:MAG TPA: ATP-binding cassette domain-containing protein [Mycobacteriales bacterium]|nr:ATP-binding cassette domain-containing protein [Mycobacteriales bacterium]